MEREQETGEESLPNSVTEQESVDCKTKDKNVYPQNSVEETTVPGGCSCGSQSGKMSSPPSFVYAIGKVTHRFPNKSVESEFFRVTSLSVTNETTGMTHHELRHKILTDPDNRYIARQGCYVLTVGNVETYIIIPSDPLDLDKFVQTLRPVPSDGDIDLVIGRRGQIAPPEMCNGLLVPVVMVDQLYIFHKDDLINELIKQIRKDGGIPEGVTDEQFKKTAEALFNNIIQITDNAGATDEHRAINFLSVCNYEIYVRAQLMQNENYSFTNINIRPSPLSGARKILDVIFSYENRASRAVQKWFTRVDVTEEFPFQVSPLQQRIEY